MIKKIILGLTLLTIISGCTSQDQMTSTGNVEIAPFESCNDTITIEFESIRSSATWRYISLYNCDDTMVPFDSTDGAFVHKGEGVDLPLFTEMTIDYNFNTGEFIAKIDYKYAAEIGSSKEHVEKIMNQAAKNILREARYEIIESNEQIRKLNAAERALRS